MPQRGVVIGVSWNGSEGAGNRILATKIECSKERIRLVNIWRPFQEAVGRRDVREAFPAWIQEEAKWAEGRLVVALDFPFSLAETHLRQLGLLRQALRGPPALGKGLEDRYLPQGIDFTEAADAFKASLGKDRARLADCYRAVDAPPSHHSTYRETFFGLCVLANLDGAFPPWEPPRPGQPVFVEVHPPHVARVLCGTCAYRDDSRDGVNRASTRAAILRTLRNAARLEFEMEQAAQIIEDEEGIALDAVLGSVAAAAALEQGFYGVPANVPRSEGWIYSVREEPWRGS
jgi:hypothetical protein